VSGPAPRSHEGEGTGSPAPVVGVDAGATLAKLAVAATGGALRCELLPAEATEEIASAVASLAPRRAGLAGGGAAALAAQLAARGVEAVRVNEFAAWGTGAAALLREQGSAADQPYLLVSLGTGTSVMLADGMSVSRIGGTALGGGTVVGLGALLLGGADFEPIAALAARGDRRAVDLLVSDIYRPGEIPLTGDLTAANFGRLSRVGTAGARREDLAQAIMGLVGENVALICGGLGAARQVRRVVFAGSTLRDNPSLRRVLSEITSALGGQPVFLEGGEFAGALGALRLAAERG
jgi:type II pantothenate kinase